MDPRSSNGALIVALETFIERLSCVETKVETLTQLCTLNDEMGPAGHTFLRSIRGGSIDVTVQKHWDGPLRRGDYVFVDLQMEGPTSMTGFSEHTRSFIDPSRAISNPPFGAEAKELARVLTKEVMGEDKMQRFIEWMDRRDPHRREDLRVHDLESLDLLPTDTRCTHHRYVNSIIIEQAVQRMVPSMDSLDNGMLLKAQQHPMPIFKMEDIIAVVEKTMSVLNLFEPVADKNGILVPQVKSVRMDLYAVSPWDSRVIRACVRGDCFRMSAQTKLRMQTMMGDRHHPTHRFMYTLMQHLVDDDESNSFADDEEEEEDDIISEDSTTSSEEEVDAEF